MLYSAGVVFRCRFNPEGAATEGAEFVEEEGCEVPEALDAHTTAVAPRRAGVGAPAAAAVLLPATARRALCEGAA